MKRLFLLEIVKFSLFFAVILSMLLWLLLSIETDAGTKSMANLVIANSIEKVKYDTEQYEILRNEFHSSNISKVRTLALIIAEDPSVLEDKARLFNLKDVLDVDEIYVSDENGIGRWGTHDYGYFNFADYEQGRPFLKALSDKDFVFSQEPMKRGADGVFYQYSGAARIDKPGIVQVGMAPHRMEFFFRIGFLSKISDISPILENGFVVLTDKNSGKIISFKEGRHIGSNISDIGLPKHVVLRDGNWDRFIIDGTDCFILTRVYDKYAYLAIIPYGEAKRDKDSKMLFALVIVIFSIALMVILITVLLQKHILSGIRYLINSMSEITGGRLETKVDLKTCDEFRVLSSSINDMVDYLKRLIEKEKIFVKETERLTSIKSQFLARMSHEIRTPINVITGMSVVGTNNVSDRERVLEVFEDIKVASRHLLSVINDILDMSKIEAGKLEITSESFYLSSDIDDVMTMMSPKAQEEQLVFTVVKENIDGLKIISDKLRLNQVLLNLLSNAMKFTPKGESVELTVRKTGSDGKSADIFFSVKDTGIGMTKNEADSLFRPFQQADGSITRRFGGTGLGLSISRSILELMGSKFAVKSEKGKGTEFSFSLTFPLSGEKDNAPARENTGECGDFSGFRILLVDDVDINRKVICALLEKSGVVIDEAVDGAGAAEKYKNAPDGYYDVILMDIHMPDVDGYKATALIRGSGKADASRIPIVAVTADAFKETINKVFVSGMNDYISKPIDFKKLCSVINKYFHKK